MKPNTVTIITIPLVYYHEEIYWGIYEEHHGKTRNEIRCRPTAGRQVSFAYNEALSTQNDILLAVDDKFTIEKAKNEDPLDVDLNEFLSKHPLPDSWVSNSERFVCPPEEFKLTNFSFSERKLLKNSKNEYGLSGDCANEWSRLLSWLESQGYETVEAYFPKVCAKGICYATPYAKEAGIYTKPLEIYFTHGDKIDSKI